MWAGEGKKKKNQAELFKMGMTREHIAESSLERPSSWPDFLPECGVLGGSE